MSKKKTFRLQQWAIEFLDKFGKIYQCKNETETLHKALKKLEELTAPKKVEENSFLVGTKVKCLARNEYFDMTELPCIAKNIYCTNEACFERVKKLFEQSRKKPSTEIHGMYGGETVSNPKTYI